MPTPPILRYDARVRHLTVLATALLFAALVPHDVAANGGALVYNQRHDGYDVSVSVWPPQPKTGLLAFTVLVQAVAATNGHTDAQLAPISTDLTLHAQGPANASIGPIQPRPVQIGVSHFDMRVPLERAGQWVFTFHISGPLGDTAADVQLEIYPDDDGPTPWIVPAAIAAGLASLALALAVTVRRIRRPAIRRSG